MRIRVSAARGIAVVEGLIAAVTVGLTPVVLKLLSGQIGPVSILAYRYALASIPLLAILTVKYHRVPAPIPAWRDLLLLGLALYVLGNGAFLLALKWLDPTTASLVLNLLPLVVALGSIALLKEAPGRLQSIGMLVAAVGAGLYFAPTRLDSSWAGLGMMVLALIGNAAYDLHARRFQSSRKADTLAVTAIPLALAALLLLPAALAIESPPHLSLHTWGLLLTLAVINTALPFLLINEGLKRLAAYQMAALISVAPLMTAIWTCLLLGEGLLGVEAFGMLVLIGGTALVQLGSQG